MGNNKTFLTPGGESYRYDGIGNNPAYSDLDHFGSNPGNPNGMPSSTFITIKKTIGRVGVAGCDFNFAAAADHLVQNLDLGAIIPAKAKVKDVHLICIETVVGVTNVNFNCGNGSGSSNYFGATSCITLNQVVTSTATVAMNWAADTHVWLGADPSDNTWNAMTAGKWEVYITYQVFV